MRSLTKILKFGILTLHFCFAPLCYISDSGGIASGDNFGVNFLCVLLGHGCSLTSDESRMMKLLYLGDSVPDDMVLSW